MKRFRHIEDLINQSRARPCAAPGCTLHGEHRAPISRYKLDEYQWLCGQHIVEFNKKWDYFTGMSQPEIERFQKEATFGHRPTWKINEAERHAAEKLQAAFSRFMGDEYRPYSPAPPIPARERAALADLDLEHPSEAGDIKRQYKKLVKKFHPDRNPNDPKAEERFKQITASYHFLMQEYAKPVG